MTKCVVIASCGQEDNATLSQIAGDIHNVKLVACHYSSIYVKQQDVDDWQDLWFRKLDKVLSNASNQYDEVQCLCIFPTGRGRKGAGAGSGSRDERQEIAAQAKGWARGRYALPNVSFNSMHLDVFIRNINSGALP